MDAWMDRWKERRNNDVMLYLDSYQVNQFLPLPTGYKFSPWIRQMLGSVISSFPNHSASWPTQLHLPILVDENSGTPWSKKRFVWVSSRLREILVLLSLSKGEYCQHSMHTPRQAPLKISNPSFQDLLRVTYDLYFVILPFDENRCYLFLTPRHLELGKLLVPTSLP